MSPRTMNNLLLRVTGRRILLLAASLALIGLLLVVLAVRGWGGGQASAETVFAVYLQPASVPAEKTLNLATAADVLGEREFMITDNLDSFEQLVANKHPQSIWVYADAWDDVPAKLLRDQLDAGVVIVGIDLPSRAVTDKLGVDSSSTPDWKPAGLTTFVIFGQALNVPYTNELGGAATRGSITSGNDYFDPANPGRLIFMVSDVISEVQDTYSGTP